MGKVDVSDDWERARLIPVYGIRGAEEQERRAVSALLAVLTAVPDFGNAITGPLGAPKSRIDAYTEVTFKRSGGKVSRPDGVLHVERGKKTWACIVEVKTGDATLKKDQIEEYLDVAKEYGYDCVVTVSNEIEKIPGEHPVSVDKRRLRSVGLFHLSWSRIITEAIIQQSHRGVSDPDQAWILSELIRYLDHENAGAGRFASMGKNWVSARDAVKNGTARKSDAGVQDVAGTWEELVTFVVLNLRKQLGVDVTELLAPQERGNIDARIATIIASMVENGRLPGAIHIPDSVGPIEFYADLRSQQIVASVSLNSPRESRQTTRVNWLLKQLKDAPAALRIESRGLRSRSTMSELLGTARTDAAVLVPNDGHEIASFTVSLIKPMGLKDGAGKSGTFIDSVISAIDEFYGTVVQNLKSWQPPAPKLRPDAGASQPAQNKAETRDVPPEPDQTTADDPSDASLDDVDDHPTEVL